MSKCKQCGVPLDGPLSIIGKIMGVKRSDIDPELCNKCAEKAGTQEESSSGPVTEASESIVPRPEELGGTQDSGNVGEVEQT